MNRKIIISNIMRMGRRVRQFEFPVFETKVRGYYVSCALNSSPCVKEFSYSSYFSPYGTTDFVELNKNDNLRIVTNGDPEDHSFYNDKIKAILEYLSEPRWILASRK